MTKNIEHNSDVTSSFVKLHTEDMCNNYHQACVNMQVSLAKLLGKNPTDPDVIEFSNNMILAVQWEREYSMQLAMDSVARGWSSKL
jgi:hypothetical protein